MTVEEMKSYLGLKLIAGEKGLKQQVKGGYCGDLLSFVMAHAKEGEVWMTVQGHINTIAVALMVGVAAVILVEGVEATDEMISRANEENIPLFLSSKSSFELVSELSRYL